MTRSSRFSNHLRPYGLDSWSAVACDLLPNRLTALGQVSMFFENYTEETKCINQDHRVITDSVVIKWFERTF